MQVEGSGDGSEPLPRDVQHYLMPDGQHVSVNAPFGVHDKISLCRVLEYIFPRGLVRSSVSQAYRFVKEDMDDLGRAQTFKDMGNGLLVHWPFVEPNDEAISTLNSMYSIPAKRTRKRHKRTSSNNRSFDG